MASSFCESDPLQQYTSHKVNTEHCVHVEMEVGIVIFVTTECEALNSIRGPADVIGIWQTVM